MVFYFKLRCWAVSFDSKKEGKITEFSFTEPLLSEKYGVESIAIIIVIGIWSETKWFNFNPLTPKSSF